MAWFDRLRPPRLRAAVAAGVATACFAAAVSVLVGAREDPRAPRDRQEGSSDLGFGLTSTVRRRPPPAGSGALIYRNGRYTPLAAVPGATFSSLHFDVNGRGETVGISIEAVPDAGGTPQPGATHGFVQDRRGRATTVDIPGAMGTTVWGNNDRGQAVGFSLDPGAVAGPGEGYPTDAVHVFVRDRHGRITTLDLAVPYLRGLGDIDDRGQIVGTYTGDDGTFHGFRREPGGRITTIDVPEAVGTLAFGIDDGGRVVGYYADRGTTPNPDGSFPARKIHAFLWDEGRVTRLDVPGSSATYAIRINDRGQITGGYYDTTGTQHGFLLDRGRYRTLTPPGRTESTALGLDDHGTVVIPEPTTRFFTVATR